jgi:phosphoribosyl 1,2-cyclic phosphodiesterase
MSLFVSSLNSGSNGNCYYIGNQSEAILVDVGISRRKIEKRMTRLGLIPKKIKAIFITHEHDDHISGIVSFIKKYPIPVYITTSALIYSNLKLNQELVVSFKAHEPISIGNITVTAFSKHHDASDPYNFVIHCNETQVGIFTDTGTTCHQLIKYFKQCHAAFLETNYDEKMLEVGRYPRFLKNRISGGLGHLSNRQALELFLTHRPAFMSHLFLSHLSKNNNCPNIVSELFNKHAGNVKMIIASRDHETAVYHIQPPAIVYKRRNAPLISTQLSFSFT